MADNTMTFFSRKFTSLRPFEKKHQEFVPTWTEKQVYLLTLMRVLYLQIISTNAVDSGGFTDTAVSLHVKTE